MNKTLTLCPVDKNWRDDLGKQLAQDRLDIAITKADRNLTPKMNDLAFQLTHAEIPQATVEVNNVVIESMLPHKQILRDRLGDVDYIESTGSLTQADFNSIRSATISYGGYN